MKVACGTIKIVIFFAQKKRTYIVSRRVASPARKQSIRRNVIPIGILDKKKKYTNKKQ